MIVPHKKGEPAGFTTIIFLGPMRSYWSEDGWHDTETMQAVPKPKIRKKKGEVVK